MFTTSEAKLTSRIALYDDIPFKALLISKALKRAHLSLQSVFKCGTLRRSLMIPGGGLVTSTWVVLEVLLLLFAVPVPGVVLKS